MNFKKFETDEKFDTRIRLLIKNMFDNKDSGWKKSKDEEEKGPMKVEEFHKKEKERQLAKERALAGYDEEKKAPAATNYKKKETKIEPLSEEKIGEKAIKCFKNFVQIAKVEQENEDAEIVCPNVNAFIELFQKHGASSSDIYYNFLMKFYDENIAEIETYQPLFFEMVADETDALKYFDKKGISEGVSRFIQSTGDLEADVPKISAYFGKTLYELYD